MRVRFRSSRAPFRRAGLEFTSTATWLEVAQDEISPANRLRLLAEPVLAVEVEEPAGDGSRWVPVPEVLREAARLELAQQRAGLAGKPPTEGDENGLEALRLEIERLAHAHAQELEQVRAAHAQEIQELKDLHAAEMTDTVDSWTARVTQLEADLAAAKQTAPGESGGAADDAGGNGPPAEAALDGKANTPKPSKGKAKS